MIVREYKDKFILIEQDHHARISGEIMKYWKDSLFKGKEWRSSVEYAINNHDLGWKAFDLEPFWNDAKRKPYSFIDFPTMPKTALYTYGIDAVEKLDPYAGLLCSSHYTRFMENDKTQSAKQFVRAEKERQQQLITKIPDFNEKTFQYHFGLLRFSDDLSLYLCLNEPGTTKETSHHFFQSGINVRSISQKEYLTLYFTDKQTLVIEDFPFTEPFSVSIRQKIVYKQDIAEKGLMKSYKKTPYNEIKITLTSNQ